MCAAHMGGDKPYCQAACRKGKPHKLERGDRQRKCEPISVDAAHNLITDLLSAENEIPQP